MEVTWAKHNESEPWASDPTTGSTVHTRTDLTVSKGTGSRIKSRSPWRKSESPARSAGRPLSASFPAAWLGQVNASGSLLADQPLGLCLGAGPRASLVLEP